MIKSMENAFSVKGKNCIVTGGSRGIGKGVVLAFAQSGANVAILSRDSKTAEDVIGEIKGYGGKYKYYKCDVSNPNDCKRSIEEFCTDYEKIDVVVNNTGISRHIRTLDMSEEFREWHDVMDVNVNGAFYMCYYAALRMKDTGGGSIINITSISSRLINHPQFQVSYHASKAAEEHMTRALAVEWVPYNIRVNAIAPGYVDTDQLRSSLSPKLQEWREYWAKATPKGRFGSPLEIGALAVYLASEAAENAIGATFTLDGGYILPK